MLSREIVLRKEHFEGGVEGTSCFRLQCLQCPWGAAPLHGQSTLLSRRLEDRRFFSTTKGFAVPRVFQRMEADLFYVLEKGEFQCDPAGVQTS